MAESSSTIKPWLKALISAELSVALQWKRLSSPDTNIKPDPDGDGLRFDDDGSNLRTQVTLRDFPPEPRVQLLKVTTLERPVTVVVSDGDIEVHATLGYKAIRAYERAIDDDFFEEISGDILRLKAFGVTATPFGPAREQILLSIKDLEYERHRHKLYTGCTPIQTFPDIKDGLMELARMIEEQGEPHLDKPSSSAVAESITQDSAMVSEPRATPKRKTSVVQQAVPSTQRPEVQTQVDMPKQSTQRRQQKVRTRAKQDDDVFIYSGVNLAPPRRAGYSAVQKDGTTSPTTLLNIMDKNKPHRRASAAAAAETAPLVSQLTTVAQDKQRSFAIDQEEKQSIAMSNETKSQSQSDTTTSDVYKIRLFAIPPDQEQLLADKSSWVLAEPGFVQRQSNVPAALLEAWDEARMASQDESISDIAPATQLASQTKSAGPKPLEGSSKGFSTSSQTKAPAKTTGAVQPDSSDDDDDDDDDDDEPLDSQWSISPSPPKRPELPPDSSGIVRATPSPRKAEERPSTASSMEQMVPRAASMTGQEQHQADRRKFMREAQRIGWLKENYAHLLDGKRQLNAKAACADYKAKYSFNDEPVTEGDMRRLWFQIWHEHYEQRRGQEADGDKSGNVRKSNTDARASELHASEHSTEMANSSTHKLNQSGACTEEINLLDPLARHSQDRQQETPAAASQFDTATNGLLLEKAGHPLVVPDRTLIHTDHDLDGTIPTVLTDHHGEGSSSELNAADATAATRTIQERTTEQPMEQIIKHSGEQPSSVATNHLDAAPDHLTTRVPATVLKEKSRRRIIPQQRLPRPDEDPNTTDKKKPPSKVDKFMRDWRNLKPGGAFARSQTDESSRVRKHIDVLSWELSPRV